jgi:hypothetical protein
MGFVELTGRDDRPVYVNLAQVIQIAQHEGITRLIIARAASDRPEYLEVQEEPRVIYDIAVRIRE